MPSLFHVCLIKKYWQYSIGIYFIAVAPAATPTPKVEQKTVDQSKGNLSQSLFGVLNKGNVTAGLRKVDKSEMTHKNPELRAGSIVKISDTPIGNIIKKFNIDYFRKIYI